MIIQQNYAFVNRLKAIYPNKENGAWTFFQTPFFPCVFLQYVHVDRAKLLRIFRVSFRLERHFLSFSKTFIAFHDNRREMHENIVAALVVRNEAITLLRVEPFNSSLAHLLSPPIKFFRVGKNRFAYAPLSQTSTHDENDANHALLPLLHYYIINFS